MNPTKRIAPGPRGSLVMGNLAEYRRDPITMLLRLQQQHGDVARNRLGPFLTHALAHPTHVQHVLQDNARNYTRGRFYENFKLFFGDGLLTTDGEFWRRHRRAVQPLFHKKHVEAHTAAVGGAALALVDRWNQLPPGEAVDVIEDMMHLSLSMLGLMVFNADISKHARQVGPAVRFGIEAMMPQGNLNDFIPRWLPTRFNQRVAQARKGIDLIIGQIIADHRDGRCETSDVISLLLASRHPETGEPMTEQEVHDEVMTVFLAGHETTGSGLAWALYALAQHPAELRRLREELDARLAGRAPTLTDLEALPYLDQVVQEVLRVYPPIWGFTRDLVADDEIGGFHIPAGSSIFVSPYVTHRHPEFWPNPDAFDPENFGPGAPARHKFAYLPFGGGMRKCVGFQTALLQMRVLVAVVAQHFDLSALPGHPIERGALISLRPLQGIRLIIKPRSAPSARRPAPSLVPPGKPAVNGCPFHHRAAEEPATPAKEEPGTAPPVPAPGATAIRSMPAAPTEAGSAVPAWRFTWFPVEIEALPLQPAPALAGKRVAIVNGKPGTAERVAIALARACAQVSLFAPAPGADVPGAALAFAQRSGPFDGIVDLGLEAGFSLETADQWEAPMRRSVALLQACYEDWQAEADTARLFYVAVTWMDGLMGYGEGEGAPAEQPLGGLWSGLAKTLPQELPNCNVRVLDLAPDEAGRVEQHLGRELYRWGLFEVGYRDGRRYTLQARRHELTPTSTATSSPGLTAGDVVLFSGGARGIGLLCARALAERHGATVIVTGREQPADGSEAWMQLDDAGFKAYGQDQLRQATPQRTPATIRQELARRQRRRELRASLDALAAHGLPVRYRMCDVTDAAAVRRLCDEFGPALRLVIHNAGVDRPVRLLQKTADSFVETVRTKVMGFTHLCAAVADRPGLVQFCNIGSLTGRWGGMTGETDYAAANEALARLGLWARRHALPCSVKTLVWPTWEGVGMITNLAVTKRYVTSMATDEGVEHWLRELADRGSGEIMFMGAVGRALTPIQIKGFSPIFDLRNISQLVTMHHHAGQPLEFRPSARFSTRYWIEPANAPFAQAFRLDGCPALPASMLMEHACAVGAWVGPEDFRPRELAAVVNVLVDLDELPWAGPAETALQLHTEATGAWRGDDWQVDVRCRRASTDVELLRLTLVYRDHASGPTGQRPAPRLEPGRLVPVTPLSPRRAAWNGQLLPAAEWQEPPADSSEAAAGVVRVGHAPAANATDLWALALPPDLRLPVNHLENVLQSLWSAQAGAGESALRRWRIRCIVMGPAPAASARRIVQHADGRFGLTDAVGWSVMELHGAALESTANEPLPKGFTSTPPPLITQHAPLITHHSPLAAHHSS